MKLIRSVLVFDAADVEAVSAFWAGMYDGFVVDDDPAFHCVIDASGEWVIGVQRAPDHVQPEWPDGAPQQVHVDFHVEDARQAHEHVTSLGARLLQAGDFDAEEGFQVYADPAGHPFCLGWGQPSPEALAAFLRSFTAARTTGSD